MTSIAPQSTQDELSQQMALWRRQAGGIPALRGGKAVWVALVFELVRQVGAGNADDLSAIPVLPPNIVSAVPRAGGAAPQSQPLTWLEYYRFLKGLRLAQSSGGELRLTSTGLELDSDPTQAHLATILADQIRLFSETLSFVASHPCTIDEVDKHLQFQYETSWKSFGGTRSRMDWLEVLDLIEGIGNRRWQITASGQTLLRGRTIVTPEAISQPQAHGVTVADTPAEISALLNELVTSTRTHDSRSTYNIWVPSPALNPNKVENLRTIVNAALNPIGRSELLAFISDTFNLKRSSVDSMMPFMRASGLLHEVGLGIYQATPSAQAWLESGDDINFVRILHANMRFVGEMIRAVEGDVTRHEMYSEAKRFGLNIDKARWIASFLEDTGLIEKPRYGSIRATPYGVAISTELPLAEPPDVPKEANLTAKHKLVPSEAPPCAYKDNLIRFARDPRALGEAPGKAFETAIRDAFRAMGFNAETIGGAGNTDVLVRWRDEAGSELTAIVEAKSRSTGSITHSDISDVALETHKSRHGALFAAVVGPDFSGDTIKNMAAKREWSLVDAERLGTLVECAIEYGLRPHELGRLFQVPNGFSEIEDLISQRRRELNVLSLVVAQLIDEANDSGDAITARDISRDGRRTELTPSVDEVLAAAATLSQFGNGALRMVDHHDDPKFVTYVLGDVRATAQRLRAVADAIEKPLGVIP